MIEFILNDQNISTELPPGTTVLDFVRYHKDLKGTKIGCREGDCGACTVLVGELVDDDVKYRTMTCCLMPLANAAGKHVVTIEGINPADGSLTPVQNAIVDESGTQCGFCTVGFVVSLTGFCIDDTPRTADMAISSVDGNICRCTGYKSIERAAAALSEPPAVADGLAKSIENHIVPEYFVDIPNRLNLIVSRIPRSAVQHPGSIIAGGTDVYVQKPDELPDSIAEHLFYDENLRGIRDKVDFIEIGASATVTDLLESPVMRSIFPDLYKQLKLVSSTPIRNMATLAGNFVNASPIGDMTAWFLALDAGIVFSNGRETPLRKLYLDYKKVAKTDEEFVTIIKFRKPGPDHYFNFEKVSKRTYLDIATVNTAISLRVETTPGKDWVQPVLSEPPASAGGSTSRTNTPRAVSGAPLVDHLIINAHVSAGGVAPIPLYLKETSSFLIGRQINPETIEKANEIIQAEISPISDVRGSADYKRLLLRQLFKAHFYELFGPDAI